MKVGVNSTKHLIEFIRQEKITDAHCWQLISRIASSFAVKSMDSNEYRLSTACKRERNIACRTYPVDFHSPKGLAQREEPPSLFKALWEITRHHFDFTLLHTRKEPIWPFVPSRPPKIIMRTRKFVSRATVWTFILSLLQCCSLRVEGGNHN